MHFFVALFILFVCSSVYLPCMLTQALKVLRTADFAPVIVFIAAPSVVTVGDVPCANVSPSLALLVFT